MLYMTKELIICWPVDKMGIQSKIDYVLDHRAIKTALAASKAIPRAKSTSSAATATAEPLEDPPGICEGIFGFVGVPYSVFSPVILK